MDVVQIGVDVVDCLAHFWWLFALLETGHVTRISWRKQRKWTTCFKFTNNSNKNPGPPQWYKQNRYQPWFWYTFRVVEQILDLAVHHFRPGTPFKKNWPACQGVEVLISMQVCQLLGLPTRFFFYAEIGLGRKLPPNFIIEFKIWRWNSIIYNFL